MEEEPVSIERIAEAAEIIDPVFLHSPQYECEPLSAHLGVTAVLKVECLNPIRSFKGRGTDYLMHRIEVPELGLVCASAGNFGQGMAYAARKRGHRVIVFAAAPIAEGAGTMAVELSTMDDPIDAILVPLGDGALMTGIGAWMRRASPSTRIIGVVAEGAPAMELSWHAAKLVATESIATIADGIAVRVPVASAVEDVRNAVDDVMHVSDIEMIEGMRALFSDAGLVVEPAGAAGIAAVKKLSSELAGKRVAVIITGGNITTDAFQRLIS